MAMGFHKFAGTAALALTVLAGPAAAEMRALVIGINDYQFERKLLGAIADAEDLRQTFEKRKVKDLTTVYDKDATRDRVLAELDKLVARAQKGDTVFITYAGHGSQEAWGDTRPPDAKKGELHSIILMRDFKAPIGGKVADADRKFVMERISGREITDRIRQMDAKGVTTVYVADTCHGGGLTRSLNLLAGPQSYRSGSPYGSIAAGDDPLAAAFAKTGGGFDHLKEIPSLTFLAAVDQKHTAPEVTIPGQKTRRGALSYGLARALLGEGDADGDGKVSRKELFGYLRSNISMYSQSEQVPELQPAGEGESSQPVFDIDKSIVVETTAPAAPIRIYVDGAATLPASVELTQVPGKEGADLIWRVADGSVVSDVGDLIVAGAKPADMPKIAERTAALRKFTDLARPRPLALELAEGNGRHKAGTEVHFAMNEAATGSYYAMFNLAGDGTVQYLYPNPAKKDALQLGGDRVLTASQVTPPFGSDFLVVATSKQPLDGLIGELIGLDGKKDAMAAVRAMERVKNPDLRIGVQGLFTGE